MSPGARPLDPVRDLAAVEALFAAAADYMLFETGRSDPAAEAASFFTPMDAEGGAAPLELRRGLVLPGAAPDGPPDGPLDGLIDAVAGWPGPADWFVGLLLLRPEARGRGLGAAAVQALAAEAMAARGERMLAAVLDANAPARAFWTAMGFRADPAGAAEVETGLRTHRRLIYVRPLIPTG